PGGPASVLSTARVIGRNWPMAVLLVLIGGLFWPTRSTADDGDDELTVQLRPHGPDPDLRSGIGPQRASAERISWRTRCRTSRGDVFSRGTRSRGLCVTGVCVHLT